MIRIMYFPRALFLLPALCLYAQTPSPNPAPKPAEPVTRNSAPSVATEILRPKAGVLPDVPADHVIMSIGEEKLTAGEFAQLIETLPENVRGQARGPARRQLAESIIKVKLLAQEARRRKADEEPLFKVQQTYQLENLLAIYFLNNYLRITKVPDEETRKYYEEHKGDYEAIRARHILIRFKGSPVALKPNQPDLTDAEALAKAQDLRKQLLGGADFATLAKAESDDRGSGSNGGDLGEFKRGQMVPAFDQAAGTLPIGQISEPVKSQYGYHIIKVESRQAKTFEEVRDDIDKRLRPQLADKFIADLRAKAGVTMDDSYFK